MPDIPEVEFDAATEAPDHDEAPGFGSTRTDELSEEVLAAPVGVEPDLES